MWAELLRHPAALLFSIVGHALVLSVLVFGLHRAPVALRQPASAEPIKAIAVNEQQVRDALRQLEQADRREQQNREQAKQALEKQLAARKQEEQRVAELKRQAAEQERLAKIKQEQAKVEQQQREQQQRLAAQETKRKAEEEARKQAAAKRKAQEEARKQAAEEARNKAEAAAREKAAAEARRKAELAAALDREEDERRLAQERRRLQSLRAQYEVAIVQKVQRNWLRPPSVTSAMHCVVLVNQIPSGDVTRVEILDCEGGGAFQRSVEVAVRKASPLPSPPDPALFDREIQFTFRPEN